MDQWFRKPGHPVVEYGWTYANGELKVTLKQTQDTKDGTPIFRVPNARVGAVVNGKLEMLSAPLDAAEETYTYKVAATPTAVVLDPDHDYLRVAKPAVEPDDAANLAILKLVKDPAQRTAAMVSVLKNGSPADVDAAIAALKADDGIDPAFRAPNLLFGRRQAQTANPTSMLADLKRPELRAFWTAQIDHKNANRRALAVAALGDLPADPATTARIKGLVNDKEYTAVVVASPEGPRRLGQGGQPRCVRAGGEDRRQARPYRRRGQARPGIRRTIAHGS